MTGQINPKWSQLIKIVIINCFLRNGTGLFEECKTQTDVIQKFVTWWKGSFLSGRQNVFCWWSIIWWWLWKTIFVFSGRTVVVYSAQPVRGNTKFWKADPPAVKASILPSYGKKHEQFLLLYTIIRQYYGRNLQNSKVHKQMLDIWQQHSLPHHSWGNHGDRWGKGALGHKESLQKTCRGLMARQGNILVKAGLATGTQELSMRRNKSPSH